MSLNSSMSKLVKRKSMYNYSFLERRDEMKHIPTNRLRVYYMSVYGSGDTGDITVCNSYNDFDYSADINSSGFRNTDLVDLVLEFQNTL